MKLMRSSILVVTLAAPLPSLARANELAPARRTENVVLVTLDGLRWQEVFRGAEETLLTKENGGVKDIEATRALFWRDTPGARREALLPFMWNVIAKDGQLWGNADKESRVQLTNGKKFSYPGYNEILTGAADPRVDSNDKKPNPNETVLEWLEKKPAFEDKVAAFCSWDVFPYILNRERSGLFVNAGDEPVPGFESNERQKLLNELMRDTTPPFDGVRHDSFTLHSAIEYVKARKPRVLYVAFDATDDFAHDGRYDRVLAMAHQTDAFVRLLWETLQSIDPYRGKTTLLVTTDHGRGDAPTEWKNHGEKTAGAEDIWLAVLGPDTPALGERTKTVPATQSQIAATLALFLGEDWPAASPKAGKPILEAMRK